MTSKKEKIRSIDCEEAVKRFNDFLDNYLKGKSRKELVNHISNCRHCFDRLEFEQLLKSKVRHLSKCKKDQSIINRVEKIISSF